MRIEIVLRNKRQDDIWGSLLKSIAKEDNYKYLEKGDDNPDFPCLSEVETCDHAFFDCTDMEQLIRELLTVRDEVSDLSDKEHIDEIIGMAEICKKDPDLVLIFYG